MKRFLTLVLMLIAATGILFANGGEEDLSGPVTLEFWTTETQSDRLAVINTLADVFEEINPDITVDVVAVDENDMATQINSAAVAGTLPSLVQVATENAVAFGTEGLLNTEAASKVIEDIGKNEFYSGVLRLNQMASGDSYYAVPFHGWVQGIWYRADWFEEAGLNPPKTWDDILAAAKYFNKPKENQYGILIGTMAEAFTEQVFTQFARSNDAWLFDGDGNLTLDTPEMRETLEYYAELAKYTPPGPQTWRARDYYIQGKMAMFFYSTYIMDDLAMAEVAAGSLTSEHFKDLTGASFDPDLVNNTKMVSAIHKTRDAGYGTIVSLTFPDTKDKDKTIAAVRFAKYLFETKPYISFLHMSPGGKNPVLRDIATDPDFQRDPSKLFERYGPEKMEEIIMGLDSIETFSIVNGKRIAAASTVFSKQIIPQMIYRILWEDESVDSAIAWAEGEISKLME